MSQPGIHASQPSREDQAVAEIAATRLSRTGGLVLTLGLLAAIAVGALLEAARVRRGEATAFAGGAPIPTPGEFLDTWRTAGPLAANRALREGIAALEDRLGRESALSAALRPAAQTLLARHLGYGNSQVLVGRQGWLHFRTAFDYLTGHPFLAGSELARRRAHGTRYAVPEPDPVPGLLELHDVLAARGIELVFFPVPVKAQVHPETLARLGGIGPVGPANESFPELVRRLGEGGLPVYDALPDLRAAALAGERLYLATDTHWNSAGMRVAASGLARFLAETTALPQRPPAGLRRRSFAHELEGDLTRLLGAGVRGPVFPNESIELDEVVGLGGVPYDAASAAPATASDVLLLGDSYSLVFSSAAGRSAGFAEQLAFALDRPIRRRAKVAANNLSDRVQWLREDPSLLSGVRVVIYEVTARALSSADWSGAGLEP
ncbi:MAG: hypothetical protein KBF21_08270 [Thermoanaerobaculia bacterium]|jgi:alginate O-acetyltransferase complex protein AlgJ|nr:hypothetical protein [Thermoanaerobaculia bacterium]MBP9824201.1 hypothetical protein [Thermoanaerobaculia bacterium]